MRRAFCSSRDVRGRSVTALHDHLQVGETRVDLQHLLEGLRDAYSGSLEQTILTEVIANALDALASRHRSR